MTATPPNQRVPETPPKAPGDAAPAVKASPPVWEQALTDRLDFDVCKPRPKTRRFITELDVSEVDDRSRPGMTWQAKTRELSGSSIILAARRMCYVGTNLIMAIHLIDDEPTILFGRVFACEYEAAGIYLLDVDLEQVPVSEAIIRWTHHVA